MKIAIAMLVAVLASPIVCADYTFQDLPGTASLPVATDLPAASEPPRKDGSDATPVQVNITLPAYDDDRDIETDDGDQEVDDFQDRAIDVAPTAYDADGLPIDH